jgi:uncharacterized membrane protein YdjX (TVP38/TMEM64 family)
MKQLMNSCEPERKWQIKIIRRAIAFSFIAITLLMIWRFYEPLLSAWQWFSDLDAIVASIQGSGLWGPVILFLLILVQLFVAFIPGHALVAASGYVYGAPLTIAIVSVSGVLGSQLAFFLARKYGRPLIYKLASKETIDKWDKIAGNRGPLFYFFMFVLPFVPSDMMCYVGGLGKISARRFFAANLIGRVWSTIEVALIGSYGFQPPLIFWVLFALSLVALYVAWLIYDRSVPPTKHNLKG